MVKSFRIDLAIWTQYRHVSDRRTPHDSKDRAMQSVAWVKTKSFSFGLECTNQVKLNPRVYSFNNRPLPYFIQTSRHLGE